MRANGGASYGPSPWRQASWDARAAGNFIGGGMGGSLIVFAALSGAGGLSLAALILAGLALVAMGLLSVALEIGRPRRAFRVLTNVRTSWMARESWAAMLLFPIGFAAAAGAARTVWAAAALALAFVYCQARLLQAARGIPAWREPLLSPLLTATALAEGGGLFVAAALLLGIATGTTVLLFAALVVVRFAVWIAYRRRVAGAIAPEAGAALDAAGRVLLALGTVAPLALVAAAAVLGGAFAAASAMLAGLLAAAAGAWLKLAIVTRAAYTQGFALAHLPVRGARAARQGADGEIR